MEAQRWFHSSAAAGFKPAISMLADAEDANDVDDAVDDGSILGLARRLAAQLADLDDDVAEELLDDLLTDVPSLLGPDEELTSICPLGDKREELEGDDTDSLGEAEDHPVKNGSAFL